MRPLLRVAGAAVLTAALAVATAAVVADRAWDWLLARNLGRGLHPNTPPPVLGRGR